MSLILTEKQWEVNFCNFQASLVYVVSFKPCSETLSKGGKKKKTNKQKRKRNEKKKNFTGEKLPRTVSVFLKFQIATDFYMIE